MIHSDELRKFEEQDEMFYLSHSYLSSCEFLCEAMVTEEFDADFGRSRVVLNLCHHGLELFFKAALMAANYLYKKAHNLKELHKKYLDLYPESVFEIPMPFGYTALGFGDLFPDLEKQHFNSLHQRFRYSSDNKGNRWPGIEGFIAEDFLNDVSELKKQTMKVWFEIKSP